MVTDQSQLVKDGEKQPRDLKKKDCNHTRLGHYGNVIATSRSGRPLNVTPELCRSIDFSFW